MTQEINLNVIPNGNIPLVYISQYDIASARFKYNLLLNERPYNYEPGATFKVRGLKPDRTTFEHSIDIESECSIEEDMTNVAGDVFCNIEITEGNNRTGTQAFIMRVQSDAKGVI